MSIGELADAAGLSRRAIRFYVQRGLLPPPVGRGRGSAYGPGHMRRLGEIRDLQAAGHSLEAISRIVSGEAVPPPAAGARQRPPRSTMSAELWTRLRIADGMEMSFDATRFNPDVADLLAIRAAARQILGLPDNSTEQDEPNSEKERGT